MKHFKKIERRLAHVIPFYKLRKKARHFWLSKAAGSKKLLISENDFLRLYVMLKKQDHNGTLKKSKKAILHTMLHKMDIAPLKRVPLSTITMNSQFVLKSKYGKTYELRLVYAQDQKNDKQAIPITSWLGMYLLGKHEGEKVRDFLSIDNITYQPEESQDYHH